jgi:radical SAM superfamily enzyme YgiQ (UPF0313 family)
LQRYLRLGCAISIHSSRGCHGNCSFCATPELADGYRFWQGRDICNVVDELQALQTRVREAGFLPVFNFVDDDFGSLKRIEDLDVELRQRKLKLAYSLQLRASALIGQPDLRNRIRRLREGGFTRLFIGVESLDEDTLSSWGKAYDTLALIEALSVLREEGVKVHVGYILWHAGTTVERAKAEVRRLREAALFSTKCAESRMVLFPGSRIYREVGESGDFKASGWQALTPDVERVYQQLVEYIAPIYAVWVKGAILSPNLAGWEHLTVRDKGIFTQPDVSYDGLGVRLDAVLAECDEIVYRAVTEDQRLDNIAEIAQNLMAKTEAIIAEAYRRYIPAEAISLQASEPRV